MNSCLEEGKEWGGGGIKKMGLWKEKYYDNPCLGKGINDRIMGDYDNTCVGKGIGVKYYGKKNYYYYLIRTNLFF